MTDLALAAAPGLVDIPAHLFPVRVYYEDTDAGGVVYYANYLKYAERARTEWMRQSGYSHSAMAAEEGLAFAVSRCEVDYLSAARLDDLLEVETRVTEVGGATVQLLQTVRRAGADIARIRVRLACVGRDGRPARLPAPVRAMLAPPEILEKRVM